MEATFVIDPNDVDMQLLERMLHVFKGSKGPVTVYILEQKQPSFDFQQWFQGMEAIRARTELVPVPAGIGDLNELIDSINDVDFDQP